MNSQRIVDQVDYIRSLGSLHDVFVDEITLNVIRKTVRVSFKDVYAAFADTPEYPGHTAATFNFMGVSSAYCDVDCQEGVAISAATVQRGDAQFRLDVDLRYGGSSNKAYPVDSG